MFAGEGGFHHSREDLGETLRKKQSLDEE